MYTFLKNDHDLGARGGCWTYFWDVLFFASSPPSKPQSSLFRDASQSLSPTKLAGYPSRLQLGHSDAVVGAGVFRLDGGGVGR